MWTSKTFHPTSRDAEMERTIKILKQTIISNEVTRVGSVHTLPSQIADIHVFSGNAEFIVEKATNRAVGVVDSDSRPKTRAKKK